MATECMVKQELIARMAKSTGKTEYEARIMLDAMTHIISETLDKGDEVMIRGFGVWRVKTTAPRRVRNIHTHELYHIGKKKRVVFEPGKDIIKDN